MVLISFYYLDFIQLYLKMFGPNLGAKKAIAGPTIAYTLTSRVERL
jgi:hypothetical protein